MRHALSGPFSCPLPPWPGPEGELPTWAWHRGQALGSLPRVEDAQETQARPRPVEGVGRGALKLYQKVGGKSPSSFQVPQP